MVDRLDGLGHHPIIRRHYQDGDIRYLRPPGAHGCECLMARGVQKGDPLAPELNLVSADVLGDPARFGGDDVSLPDGVQQGCLSVVDVSHDGDYRRFHFQCRFFVLCFLQGRLQHCLDLLDLHSGAELLGDQGGCFGVNRLVQGGHDSHLDQLLDHCAGLDLQPVGQVLHRDLLFNDDRFRRHAAACRMVMLLLMMTWRLALSLAAGSQGHYLGEQLPLALFLGAPLFFPSLQGLFPVVLRVDHHFLALV